MAKSLPAIKKMVYLVRHGETTENAARVHQSDNAELSAQGHAQAQRLAERLTKLPIEKIFASPWRRAHQTTEHILQARAVPVEYDPLFVETRIPSAFEGKSHDMPESQDFFALRYGQTDEHWRHSDEETFFERKTRAQQIVARLETEPAKNILVVTHGGILKTIIAYLLFGSTMTPQEYVRFLTFTASKNTGITVCKLMDDGQWKLLHWNDVAHLEGEAK